MRHILTIALLFIGGSAHAGEWGSFVGSVTTRWLPDNRNMELLEEFRYIGPDTVTWIAPKGSIINGASIPQFAWSIIGGPYEGAYRNASVIHDVACEEKLRHWKEVHRAFFTAMKASDVGSLKAKLMYAAVYHFGPRWGLPRRVSLPSLTMLQLGSEIIRIKSTAGPGADVVLTNEGVTVNRQKGLFGLQTEQEVVGAVIEIRQVQPTYSEEAFKSMEALITEKDLSLEEIEALPVLK